MSEGAALIAEVERLGERLGQARAQIARRFIGQDSVVDLSLTALLCGGHGLLVGLPGLGKTMLVDTLGKFPLPVETIPMARAHVARALEKLGGQPKLREGFVTDNGNVILDVHGLAIADPAGLETAINQIVGVVTNGLFARRPADLLLLATPTGVRTLKA